MQAAAAAASLEMELEAPSVARADGIAGVDEGFAAIGAEEGWRG